MAKYLKKFETHTQYDNYINGSDAILPNVSICTTEGDVHYNPYNPPIIDGHEYVDLGLPSGTKWATMNVGASTETDYGNYYKYGLGAEQYDKAQANYTGTENPLDSSVDTAVQVWGGSWHMPTQAQFNELTANTTYEWTTIDGVKGAKFTAQNGNYVFLPAAGHWLGGNLYDAGRYSNCWCSTPYDSSNAYHLYVGSGNMYVALERRNNGFSVRPVVG